MEEWYAKKPQIFALIQDLEEKHEQWKRMRDNEKIWAILEEEATLKNKRKNLEGVMEEFLEGWPRDNLHDQSKCSLPMHPCCIQVLKSHLP